MSKPLIAIDQLTFVVPLGPSVNEAYPTVIKQNRRTGQFYTRRIASEALQAYKQQVWGVLVELHLQNVWVGCSACGYKIRIYVRRSNADGSNYLKAYEDAVTSILGFDDQHIVIGTWGKLVDATVPRIEGTWERYE